MAALQSPKMAGEQAGFKPGQPRRSANVLPLDHGAFLIYNSRRRLKTDLDTFLSRGIEIKLVSELPCDRQVINRLYHAQLNYTTFKIEHY